MSRALDSLTKTELEPLTPMFSGGPPRLGRPRRRRAPLIAIVSLLVGVTVAVGVAAGLRMHLQSPVASVAPPSAPATETPALRLEPRPAPPVAAPAAPAPAPAAPVPAKPVPVEVDPEQQFREVMTRGLAAADRGAYGEAARSFRQAVKLNPREPDAWNSLGVVLARQGNLSGGVDALRQSLLVDGTFAPAHRNLGIALERQGRFREANPHYRAFLLLVADNHPDRDAVRARLAVPIRQVPTP